MSGGHGSTPVPYVAIRFPSNYRTFRLLTDPDIPRDYYDSLAEHVQASVREALEAMDFEFVEVDDADE